MKVKTKKPEDSIVFPCGQSMKNRFMLAPLTNRQSHEDGTISDEELHWLAMRAKGQFGIVMTCASHVQAGGKGFPGQLGIFGDQHIAGHQRLCKAIKAEGSLAIIQIFHAGMRSPSELIDGSPVSASTIERKGAKGLTLDEVHALRDDFILAAKRAQTSGYDGVEIHGAHGYIISQFLSTEINKRTDEYGGSLENRSRLLFEIIEGIRTACGPKFLLAVRLSPERFGMQLSEIKIVCQQLIDDGQTDLIDLSLWDCFKFPEEEAHQKKSLLEHFTDLNYKNVVVTVAGKIQGGEDVHKILDSKVGVVTIGRSAILHHDFPLKVINNPTFNPIELPVTSEHLAKEGLSQKFIDYMRAWAGFVAP